LGPFEEAWFWATRFDPGMNINISVKKVMALRRKETFLWSRFLMKTDLGAESEAIKTSSNCYSSAKSLHIHRKETKTQ
jgi:hypothetical protein